MSKKKNSQKKLINELKNQLLVQAESLGVREGYTPVVLEEIRVDSARKILTDFYMERANLLYELNILGSKKKEILIKLERLNSYVRKAESLRDRGVENVEKLIDKGIPNGDRARRAASRLRPVSIKVAA
jgi:archaellum component FlaC